MLRIRSAARLCGLALAAALLLAAQARRPLTHKDFDPWRTISGSTLSRDGAWLAYAYMPGDGNGELILKNLKSGDERRFPAGALPPPPMPASDPDAPPPPPRTIRSAFTSDGLYLVAHVYPTKEETAQAKKDKKKPGEMPKQSLLIVTLATGAEQRVPQVKGFSVPEKGGAWVAYQKESTEPPATGKKKEFGTDLVLRDLTKTENAERVFANVSEYSLTKDGKTLVYAVKSKKAEENGVYAVTGGEPAALKAGAGSYTKLTWDRLQTELAFFCDKSVWLWDRQKATEVVNAKTAGVLEKLAPSDKGALAFSRDGKKLFVPIGKPVDDEEKEAAPAGDDKVVMDLWRWNDDFIQPMQKIHANQERNRTYRGVYHIAEAKFVQLATPQMASVTPTDDGTAALGTDDRAYRRMVDYDGNYVDAYIVDAATGQRRLYARGVHGAAQLSPDGRWAFYFNNKAWWTLSLSDGATRSASGPLGIAFFNEANDTPGEAGAYGTAGWAKDSKSFFVYDRYDVWQLFIDGTPARNVTAGFGRKNQIEFRVARIEAPNDDEERGIDAKQPLTLRAEHQKTRETGFYRTTEANPQQLLWGPHAYQFVARAKESKAVLLTASRFDEFPDLQLTDTDFQAPKKVTNGAAQLAPFTWGTSELISYRNSDGVKLQAALFKPAGFDSTKKYPLMVYIYERLSQTVHTFIDPRPGSTFTPTAYVSDGYVVLMPDIVYETGQPGQSALKCVLASIEAVAREGWVDEARIGIAGHSWGGYQIAYMVTQTTRFRAAEAGAPVGNMTSAYSGIRWGSGLPRQFQYEKTQSRIGKTLFDDPLKYVENSPVFHVKRVTTPLLILHDDADDAVPWYQGIELFMALRRNGKEAYLMNYNGELHGLRRRPDQMDYSIRMKQFFDHFLKDAPAPEWMRKGIPYIEREEEKTRFLQDAGLK
jgi:dipeptidyl aminopeptidase/acylaminoacyl peptidase